MDDQIVGPASSVVDIWNDDGVWAVLDEGCNSTVRGSEWMERAVEAYAAVGYDVVKISDETKPFNQGFCLESPKPMAVTASLLLSPLSTKIRNCLVSSALTRLKDRKLPPSLKELRLSLSAPTAFPAMIESDSNPGADLMWQGV